MALRMMIQQYHTYSTSTKVRFTLLFVLLLLLSAVPEECSRLAGPYTSGRSEVADILIANDISRAFCEFTLHTELDYSAAQLYGAG